MSGCSKVARLLARYTNQPVELTLSLKLRRRNKNVWNTFELKGCICICKNVEEHFGLRKVNEINQPPKSTPHIISFEADRDACALNRTSPFYWAGVVILIRKTSETGSIT
jgi:hypothetical protein